MAENRPALDEMMAQEGSRAVHEEFIAAVTPASECFLELVEQGQVSLFELPNELAYLDCFEGRNWFQVFDDPEYDERYYACIDARIGD